MRSLGYQPRVQPIVIGTEPGDTVVVSLESAPNTLDVVQVLATRSRNAAQLEDLHRRTRIGLTKLVDRDQIERFGMTSALRMQPFVYLLGSGTNRYVAFRVGGGFCMPAIFVDGRPVTRFVNGEDKFDLDFWVPPDQIAAVEYARGGVPATFMDLMMDYGGDGETLMVAKPCGAIAIWRK